MFKRIPYKTAYTFSQSTVAFNFNEEVHSVVQQWPECFGVWETVREYVQVEAGRIPADTVIKNCKVVDVYNASIIEGDIALCIIEGIIIINLFIMEKYFS